MRKNPHKAWYLGPNYLKNNTDGYLINPDTNDIYWYHGMNFSLEYPIAFEDIKFSQTLYLSSNFEVAEAFSVAGVDASDDRACEVYTVAIKIPTEAIFDVRKAVDDDEFEEFAYKMFGQNLHKDIYNYFDAASAMNFELYDFVFNEKRKNMLLNKGFVGWLETEDNVPHSSELGEPLTVALLQEYTADLCIVEDVTIVKC